LAPPQRETFEVGIDLARGYRWTISTAFEGKVSPVNMQLK
jgi:hypothetical protein